MECSISELVYRTEKNHTSFITTLWDFRFSKHEGFCSGVVPIIEKDETRNVIISINPYGGAAIEVFQYTSKTPVPKDVNFLYNGYLFYGLNVKNIEKSLDIVRKRGVMSLPAP